MIDNNTPNPADTGAVDTSATETGAANHAETGEAGANLNTPPEVVDALDFTKVTVPEGVEVDEAFKALAKDIGLTNDSAGKLLGYAKTEIFDKIQAAQAESRAKIVSEWEQQTRNEFPGEKLEIAKRAYQQFTDEGFRQFMDETGLGSNPSVVKMFYGIGALMQEGKLVLGEGHATPTNSADSMFAKSISMMGK